MNIRHDVLLRPFRLGGFLGVSFLFLTLFAQSAGAQEKQSAGAQEKPAASVFVDAVREDILDDTVRVIGRLVSRQGGNLAARTGGAVVALHVGVGDQVEAGQIIAELDRTTLDANYALAKGQLKTARAQLKVNQARHILAEQKRNRLEQLRRSTAFNKAAYDDATQSLAIATAEIVKSRAEIATMRARLDLAEIERARAVILAPYRGVVLSRDTEVGAWLRPGDPVVRLLSPEALAIEAEVPARYLNGVSAGQALSLHLADGSVQVAHVRAVLPQENPRTRTRTVRLSADLTTTPGLADNQSITLFVPAGRKRPALTLHKDAIVQSPNGPLAFVVADDRAQLRRLQLGQEVGERIEVISGLAVDDLAVIRGNERLRAGQAVQIKSPSVKGQPE